MLCSDGSTMPEGAALEDVAIMSIRACAATACEAVASFPGAGAALSAHARLAGRSVGDSEGGGGVSQRGWLAKTAAIVAD